jgi:D-serine deaminase-like pyridoxal phosphate-dependent protein
MIDTDLYLKNKQIIQNNSIPLPALMCDINALEKNLQWLLSSTQKNIRIATKSIRSVEIIRYIQSRSTRFQGLMCYSLAEALWLKDLGFKDLLVAYPCVDAKWLNQLALDPSEITLMVDQSQHLDLLGNRPLQIALDLNMSTQHLGIYFGVKRSSLSRLEQVKTMLEHLKKYPLLKLTTVMGYEAQVAGVADLNKPLLQLLKKLSTPKFIQFRQTAVELIKSYGHQLSYINGGGSGSLKVSESDECLTEITAGSLFYAPTLFDQYHDLHLTPALFYALPIVRQPESNIYTCYSGGFVASGAMGRDKYPQIFSPSSAEFLPHEGAGEVQTPIHYAGPHKLKLNDPIFLRHAKAGEVCERFNHIYAFKDQQVEIYPTYRGQGVNFA